jgi:hypothetical protein
MRICCIIAFFLPIVLAAQVAKVSLDTNVIRIGEQTKLRFAIELPQSATLEWPVIGDTLQQHIEVVDHGKVDTVDHGSGSLLLVREIILTSFDTGHWAIVPFNFKINGEPETTAPLLLSVRTVDLGEDPKLRDIKPIDELPFDLFSWIRRHWYWFAVPILIALAVVALISWIQKRRRSKPIETVVEPVLPLQERIIRELQALEEERLWQKGSHKEYHSRLTDLLRQYIEERYNVPALERTSFEILHELRVTALEPEHRQLLHNMFHLSDMVKFAKAVPTPAENEQMMSGALRFVKLTAPTPVHPHVKG